MANIPIEILITARDMASGTLRNVGASMARAEDKVRDYKGEVIKATAIMAVATAGLFAFGRSAISMAADMEQNRIAFETMLGSADKARTILSDISDFARRTPFDLPQVVEGSKRLLAMGIAGEDVIDTFTMLGNIASGVGTDKLPQLILAFGQVRAAGRLTGAELRQFNEAGVPLLEELAKVTGMSVTEMAGNIGELGISFEQVQQALGNLTGEGGRFFNLMERQSKSFSGTMSNLRDVFFRTVTEIAGVSASGDIREGSLFAVLRDGAQQLLVVLERITPTLVSFANAIAQNQYLVAALGGALVALLIAPLIVLVALIGPTTLAIIGITVAIGALIGFVIASIPQWIAAWEIITTTLITWRDQAIAIFTSFMDSVVFVFTNLHTIVPFLMGFIVGFVIGAAQKLYDTVKSIISQLPGLFTTILNAVLGVVTDRFNAAVNVVRVTLPQIPSIIDEALSRAKSIFASAMDFIKGVVESSANFVIDKFNGIRNAINGAIDAMKKGFEMGKEAAGKIPGFQTGGVVPGAVGAPRLAMVHGGEEVIPVNGRRGGGSGSGGTSLTVNIGMYAGTETEKRNIAAELYEALARVARAQNVTVADMLGA